MQKCCSKCGIKAPYNPPNGIKLTESHITTYTVRNAIFNTGYYESEPYGILCPDCYKKIFKNLTRYKDKTTTETIDSPIKNFTKTTSDYQEEKPLKVKMKHYVDYQHPPVIINAEGTNQDVLTPSGLTAPNLNELHQRFGYTRV